MKSQKWLRPLRIALSIIFLAGFLLIFSDIKAKLPSGIYTFFTSSQFLPSILRLIVAHSAYGAAFLLIILITLLLGRVYCSVLCPLGIMQDGIAFLYRKLPVKKRRRKFKKPVNYLRYPILILFILSMFFFGLLSVSWLDPYSNFGRIAANLYQPAYIFLNNSVSKLLVLLGYYQLQPLPMKLFTPVTFTASSAIFLLILSMVIYRDRLYCNTICPVGTILGLLSRVSFFKIGIDKLSCTHCSKCQQACKANCINIKEMKVDMSRCVECFNCIDSCNDSAMGYMLTKRKKNESAKNTDNSKRDFLKAGLLFVGAAPLLADSTENVNVLGKQDRPDFNTRGPISPPGSRGILELKEHCTGCQLCISACPSKVLQPAFLEYGFTGMMFPKMDNNVGFCNYECTKCGEVCPTGAIHSLTKEEKVTVQIGKVQFWQHLCIVETRGTACGSCSEHCPTQAVYMVPYKDDLTIPQVNPDICVGCGACEYACPADDPHVAIFVYPDQEHQVARKPEIKKMEVDKSEDFPF
jgi:ferredoxin